ncbi:hypothetical protein [Epibacterium ulvae]
MQYFEAINSIYDDWIASNSVPSRACIVAQLPKAT